MPLGFELPLTTMLAFMFQITGAKQDEVLYRDSATGRFLQIKGGRYIFGGGMNISPTDGPLSGDVPQVEGRLEECSNKDFRCVRYSFLSLAISKKRPKEIYKSGGTTISFAYYSSRQIIATAVCPILDRTGCLARSDGKHPALLYRYTVDDNRRVIFIGATFYDSSGRAIDRYDLNLVSKKALVL
jgi:hypothetical protein